MESSANHIRAISQKMPQPSVTKIRLKITYMKYIQISKEPISFQLTHTKPNTVIGMILGIYCIYHFHKSLIAIIYGGMISQKSITQTVEETIVIPSDDSVTSCVNLYVSMSSDVFYIIDYSCIYVLSWRITRSLFTRCCQWGIYFLFYLFTHLTLDKINDTLRPIASMTYG